MTPRIYQFYIIKNYLKTILLITFIFFSAIFVLNIFEEISYFKESDKNIIFPIILTFLNTPSVLYEIFPFIFLISSQFFFIRIFEKDELNVLKNFGKTKVKIIRTITITSLFLGIFIVTIFYNLSSKFKYIYFDLKSGQSKDNKYLAVITNNGIWIKDEYNMQINIINAKKLTKDKLMNVSISQFDNDFNIIKYIYTDEADIKNNDWNLKKVIISENNNKTTKDNLIFNTNFNSVRIKSLFSNLSSLTFVKIKKLKKEYQKLGYSTSEINGHIQKLYSYPVYLAIMCLFASIVMLNIKHNNPVTFNLIMGILISVIIYYFNFFIFSLGENEYMPIELSVWLPLIIIFFFCCIGMVRINEK